MFNNMNKVIKDYWHYIVLILVTVLYRAYLIIRYVSRFIDDDSALMWYGTALAGHFGLKEPHFLGQAYGSMLESVVAVPFYWAGISLNYCLPIATFILWYSPFLLTSYLVIKDNRIISALILLEAMICRWDYDILSSLSRSFTPGFALAFLGVGLVVVVFKKNKSRWLLIPAIMIMAEAFIQTETTAIVIGVAVVYFVCYYFRDCISCIPQIIIGGVSGVILWRFSNYIFYEINPEYNLHGGAHGIDISIFTLRDNIINNVGDLLKSFWFFNFYTIPFVVIILIGMIVFILMKKEWKLLLIIFTACMGLLLMLALPKSMDFRDDLLFSQTRMFLFIPYAIIELLMFIGMTCTNSNNSREDNCKTVQFIIVFSVILLVYKIKYFELNVIDNPDLYSSSVISVISSEDAMKLANDIRIDAEENNCKVAVICTDNRAIGYATGAVNYDNYISYNANYDRRSNVYLMLKNNNIDDNVLFVDLDGNSLGKAECIHITGNLIDWIKNEKGLQRYPEGSKFRE